MIYGIDPGVTTGIVILDPKNEYKCIFSANLKQKDLYKFLIDNAYTPMTPDLVVIEEYTIFPNKFTTHAHSKVPTIQIIGALDYWAYTQEAKVVYQAPSLKVMGYKMLDAKPPKDHSYSHFMDALAHITYYLVVHKIIPNPALLKIDAKRRAETLI